MIFFLFYLNIVFAHPLTRIELPRSSEINFTYTRRIMHGHEVGDTRPYMVYLRPAATDKTQVELNWSCGGAIIDDRYILTSAACIEDVKHFYVVSGSNKWVAPTVTNNECINNGAKKAVWKCVPKSYVYDGEDFNNLRWMINDIAVVKVEDNFNFKKRIRGCDFIPKMISYNNQSKDLENPGSWASTAGWGSVLTFSDVIAFDDHIRTVKSEQLDETKKDKEKKDATREGKVAGNIGRQKGAINSEVLLETDVEIMSKKSCKKRWDERYHYIIDDYMICGKDGMDTDIMSGACEREVNCKELVYSEEDEENDRRRNMKVPDPAKSVAVAAHISRRNKQVSGGFCENDHGGPLVLGHGKTSVVIGVISANQVREQTRQCHGPFLYTSVWNNRHLISCAIDKEMGTTCRKLLRSSRTQMHETFYSWRTHPDGPSKDDIQTRGVKYVPIQNTTTDVFITLQENNSTTLI